MPRELRTSRVFPPISSDFEPVSSVYAQIQKTFPKDRDEVYVSFPITSGGAKRLFPRLPQDEVLRQQAIDLIKSTNCTFAQAFFSMAGHVFTEKVVTLPHAIGKRKDWGESHYNTLWLLFIAGADATFAKRFEQMVDESGISANLNNFTLTREQRWQQYQGLMDLFKDLSQTTLSAFSPISRMVLLPDHNESLGCSLEREFATALGITVQEVLFNDAHDDFSLLMNSAVWLDKSLGLMPTPVTTTANANEIVVFRQYS